MFALNFFCSQIHELSEWFYLCSYTLFNQVNFIATGLIWGSDLTLSLLYESLVIHHSLPWWKLSYQFIFFLWIVRSPSLASNVTCTKMNKSSRSLLVLVEVQNGSTIDFMYFFKFPLLSWLYRACTKKDNRHWIMRTYLLFLGFSCLNPILYQKHNT